MNYMIMKKIRRCKNILATWIHRNEEALVETIGLIYLFRNLNGCKRFKKLRKRGANLEKKS